MKRASDSFSACAALATVVCTLLTLRYLFGGNPYPVWTRPKDTTTAMPHPVLAELQRVSAQLEQTTVRIHETLDQTHSHLATDTRLDSVDTRLAEMQRVLGALAESMAAARRSSGASSMGSEEEEVVIVVHEEEPPAVIQPNLFEADGDSIDGS
jgi:hypothetical protein